MSWAFERLGLRPDAQERDVKRAYARHLKDTRPAEDPEGFQRLREAYEAALAQVAFRESAAVDPPITTIEPGTAVVPPAEVEAIETSRPVTAPEAAPAPEPEGKQVTLTPVDIARLLLDRVAEHPTPEAVQQWLAEQEILWRLDIKHAVADVLPWVLANFEQPLLADNLDVLWAFFDLNQVSDGAHVDQTYAYQHKRHELSLRWLMVADNQAWLTLPGNLQRLQVAWTPGFMGVSHSIAQLGRPLGWVARPAGLWTNVLRALRWGQTANMVGLLAWLSNEWQNALSPPLNGDQVRFWLRASDLSRFSKERLAVVCAQSFSVALLIVLPILVGLLFGEDWSSTKSEVVFGAMAVAFGVVMFRVMWSPLVVWQARPEVEVERLAWLHTLCIPLIVLFGALVREGLREPVVAMAIWVWAGWLLNFRYLGRQGSGFELKGTLGWVLTLLAVRLAFPTLLAAAYWVVVALLGLWAWELYKARPLALARKPEAS